MVGKKALTWTFALALALGGISLTACEQEAADHLDDAGESATDAVQSVGDAAEQTAEDLTEETEE